MLIGSAIDVHAFAQVPDVKEGCLHLGLVDFPGVPPLVGHSDGDAVAHAIADALLLACGMPDLGVTIGTSQPEWAGSSGEKILQHIAALIRQEGYTPQSVSVQIVAKRPALKEVFPLMRERLSAALGVPVNVAATTTDGQISDLGDGKAILCLASALVQSS